VNRSDLLEDSRFASAAARTEHAAELAKEIELLTIRPADQWEHVMTAVDIACARADRDVGFFLEEHPQAAANRMVVEVDTPRFGKYPLHGAIITFPDAPGRLELGSFAGEHTVRVMRDLGYTDEQIAELYSRRVIHWEEVERLPAAR
jgi:crotonobetainyl-CoA:carnitine CoA-transferase CaiB-like acyl-CoA transferase